MSRAKIIAKWDESVWIARWRTVSPFGYQAINCSRARRSTPFRLPSFCSHGAPSPCFGRLDQSEAITASDPVNETAPKNSGPFVLILLRTRITVERALESRLLLYPRAFSRPAVQLRPAFVRHQSAAHSRPPFCISRALRRKDYLAVLPAYSEGQSATFPAARRVYYICRLV